MLLGFLETFPDPADVRLNVDRGDGVLGALDVTNAVPGNIKLGVVIAGVTGTLSTGGNDPRLPPDSDFIRPAPNGVDTMPAAKSLGPTPREFWGS